MKKFYYNKESDNNDSTKQTSQLCMSDFEKKRAELLKSLNLKTPMILQLDRRHTLNVNKNGDVSRFRATSISSLDQFRDFPKIPRIRTRDVTKSLSEDYLANCMYGPSPSTVIITESDLSSSWLYNSMKDSANFRDCNRIQTPLKSKYRSEPGLSPVMLQDPKMKPIPVKKKPRSEKMSSRYCYLAILVITCLCALGFMSTIGGLIYLEVSSNNSNVEDTSSRTLIDVSDEAVEIMPKISDERAEVNINENFDMEDDSKVDQMEEHVDKDVPRRMVRILDFERKPDTDLTQFIDNTKTEIRKHDDSSVVFEEKNSPEVKFEDISGKDSRFSEEVENIRGFQNGSSKDSQSSRDNIGSDSTKHLDISKDLDFKDKKITLIGPIRFPKGSREVPGEKVTADFKTPTNSNGVIEVSSPKNVHSTETNQAEENNNFAKTEKDDSHSSEASNIANALGSLPMVSNVFQEVEIPMSKSKDDENKAFEQSDKTVQESVNTLHQNVPDEIVLHENVAKEEFSAEGTEVILQENEPGKEMLTESESEVKISHENEFKGEVLPENEPIAEILPENEPKGETFDDEHKAEILPENEPEIVTLQKNEPEKETLKKVEPDGSDLNFESMVTAINEHIKSIEIQDDVFNVPQGIVNTKVSENSRNKLATPNSQINIPGPKLSPHEVSEDEEEKTSQADIRFSLAEAMKHLQVLDTQNRILSSRMKSSKPKIKITRPRMQAIVKQPDERQKAKEQMNYLNNIRFILMDRLRNEM